MKTIQVPRGLDILGPVTEEQTAILSPEALEFFAQLQREFDPRRRQLLRQRHLRQQAIDRGEMPHFLPETKVIREGDWQVLPVPEDLQNRRVEITGPVDRKMVINALNSGANCYMADFEDSHSPTWSGTLEGQVNVHDAVRGTIEYASAEGKYYKLNQKVAALLVRPRGWHLPEKHILVDGKPASASLFDFAFYFFHNARYRAMHDSGLYLYLPKLEHHLEARLWNDVFCRAQELLGIPQGTIKATVLIEHILAAFQMEEILYELRHHSAGLNCGRWDYIFSYIKKFARKDEFIVPDRAQVTMTTPFMRAYTLSCIRACHRRGAFAMGGMAAYIPVKTDPAANEISLQKVREDKRREAQDGHDGTWVAHPGLVGIAREEFDKVLGAKPNQVDRPLDEELSGAIGKLHSPSGIPLTPALSQRERGNQRQSAAESNDSPIEEANPSLSPLPSGEGQGEGNLVQAPLEIQNHNIPPSDDRAINSSIHQSINPLLEPPKGTITEAGLRTNIRVGIQYLEAWLGGLGCVPLYNLMEDAATAEISRTQVWQWVHHPKGVLDDGRKVDSELVRELITDELGRIRKERGETRFRDGHFDEATRLFTELVLAERLEEFLTLKAYELLDETAPPMCNYKLEIINSKLVNTPF